MKHLTQAEQYIKLVPFMTHLSREHIVQSGATEVIDMETSGLKDVGECDFALYQFQDSSILVYVKTGIAEYVQLRGIYNGVFRQTHYQKAGEETREYHDEPKYPAIWDQPLDFLDMPIRVTNVLKGENILYIGELIKLSHNDVLRISNMGRVGAGHLIEALKPHKLDLGTNTGDWKAPVQH